MVYTLCKPKFNHEYALSRLKADGYRIAVCSNSVKKTIEVMMERSSLKKYLDFSLSAQDVLLPKPAPDIYLAAMEKYELEPHECLVVEDNENGLKAARASGAHVMQVHNVNEVNYENIIANINKYEVINL